MRTVLKLPQLFIYCFQQFHLYKFAAFCLLLFTLSFISYLLLLRFRDKEKISRLVSILLLRSEKSDGNALQVGGLPFSFISILGLGLLFHWFPYLITESQGRILHAAIYSWAGILLYGYADDRMEIRPIVKLLSQVSIVFLFCFTAANVVAPMNSAAAFIVLSGIATLTLNGTNLIDGLDTLSYKFSLLIYGSYILLAANIISLPALFVSVTGICIMTAFYFFNREPSRIHLGEVGVGCLGFSYVILSTLTYEGYAKLNPPLYALTKAFMPLSLIVLEVFISFARRILAGKSPFRGDRLHIHHILHRDYKLSATMTATVMALVYGGILGLGFFIMDQWSSISAAGVVVTSCLAWEIGVGYRFWFRREMKLNILDALVVKQEIRVIPANTLSDFRVTVTGEAKTSEKPLQ